MQGLVHRASDTGLDNDILDPQAETGKISSEVDKEPVFAKLPSESEIVMRDTAQKTAAVSILISGYIRIEAAPSCPPELFQVMIRTLKENA